MISLLNQLWTETTTFGHLEHWFEIAFAINLAYPILLNFGKFSGDTLAGWVRSEKDRIIAALAESPRFDQPKFSSRIEKVETNHLFIINLFNRIVKCWALLAAALLFLVVFYAAFYPATTVKMPDAQWWLLLVSGAVPIGLAVFGIVHVSSRLFMWILTIEHRGAIRYNTAAPAQAIDRAQAELSRVHLEAPSVGRPNPGQQPGYIGRDAS